MKKIYVLLLVTVLSLNPVFAFASDTNSDDLNASNNDLTKENDINLDNQTDSLQSILKPSSNNNIDSSDNYMQNDGDSDKKDTEDSNKELEISEPNDNVDSNIASDDDLSNDNDTDSTEDEIIDEDEKVHEHTFIYKSIGNGFHTVTCSAPVYTIITDDNGDELIEEKECDFEENEACTFEDGICIYCGYAEEKAKFAPDYSYEILNQSCVIGETNPLLCLNLEQEDYEIDYVQVCFANYDKNSYINTALAQGKYYNPSTDEFVYKSNNTWYACPNISLNVESGEYSLRSVYIRTTTDEYIHLSVESGTLPDYLKDIKLSVSDSSSNSSTPNYSDVDKDDSTDISNKGDDAQPTIVNDSINNTSSDESTNAVKPDDVIDDTDKTNNDVSNESSEETTSSGENIPTNSNEYTDDLLDDKNDSTTDNESNTDKGKNSKDNEKKDTSKSSIGNVITIVFNFFKRLFGF